MNTTYKNHVTQSKDQTEDSPVDEGDKIQTKCLGNILNEIILENFLNLYNNIDTLVQEGLELQIDLTRKSNPMSYHN
jgi:hypothetical protein